MGINLIEDYGLVDYKDNEKVNDESEKIREAFKTIVKRLKEVSSDGN